MEIEVSEYLSLCTRIIVEQEVDNLTLMEIDREVFEKLMLHKRNMYEYIL